MRTHKGGCCERTAQNVYVRIAHEGVPLAVKVFRPLDRFYVANGTPGGAYALFFGGSKPGPWCRLENRINNRNFPH
jgi:hypothetical protein